MKSRTRQSFERQDGAVPEGCELTQILQTCLNFSGILASNPTGSTVRHWTPYLALEQRRRMDSQSQIQFDGTSRREFAYSSSGVGVRRAVVACGTHPGTQAGWSAPEDGHGERVVATGAGTETFWAMQIRTSRK